MNPQESVRLWQIFHNKQYYLPPWETDHEEHDWSIVTPNLLRLLWDFENAFQEVLEPVADHNVSLEQVNELIISAYRRGQLEGW